jgi:hypothetical protein
MLPPGPRRITRPVTECAFTDHGCLLTATTPTGPGPSRPGARPPHARLTSGLSVRRPVRGASSGAA